MGRQKKRAGLGQDVRKRVAPAADYTRDRLTPAVENAKQRIAPTVENARGHIVPAVENARGHIVPAVESARGHIVPAVDNARTHIVPAVEDAREKVGPAVEHARNVLVDDVVPRVSTAMSHAVTVSEPYRDEAVRRGTAAYAALRGELEAPKPRRKHKWARILITVTALGGAAVAAYRVLKSGSDRQWQPMAATTPAPTSAGNSRPAGYAEGSAWTGGNSGSTTPPAPADTVGASPGEAVADRATDTPTVPTTPDAPAEHVETPDAAVAEGGASDEQSGTNAKDSGRNSN
jgi:hypothetical protein